MFHNKELFDSSGYSQDSQCYNTANMKKIGKMKCEMGGVPIVGFVDLRTKMYPILAGNGKEMKRQKVLTKQE